MKYLFLTLFYVIFVLFGYIKVSFLISCINFVVVTDWYPMGFVMIIVIMIRESFNFEIVPQLIIDVIKFLFNFHSLTVLSLIISFIHPFNPTNLLNLIILISLHPTSYHLA